MNGNSAVLDSNLLIFISKGLINWASLTTKYGRLFVSIKTYIEVNAYDFVDQSEKRPLDDLFDSLEVVEVEDRLADFAIEYRRSFKKKIKLPDALILATAKLEQADLITDNFQDFAGIDSTVVVLNLDQFRI